MESRSSGKDRLGQELPLILFYKHFDAGIQFFEIVLFEHPEIPVNSIRIINSLFLSQPTGEFIFPNQQRHHTLPYRTETNVKEVRYLTEIRWVKIRDAAAYGDHSDPADESGIINQFLFNRGSYVCLGMNTTVKDAVNSLN